MFYNNKPLIDHNKINNFLGKIKQHSSLFEKTVGKFSGTFVNYNFQFYISDTHKMTPPNAVKKNTHIFQTCVMTSMTGI